MNQHGFARVAACSPLVNVGNPVKNVDNILGVLEDPEVSSADVVVFPELCISGYTCADLFRHTALLESCEKEMLRLCLSTSRRNQLIFVGLPVPDGNELFNCAAAINDGRILGLIPKINIPNYNEFYEGRWFRSGYGRKSRTVRFNSLDVPFGTDLLFSWKPVWARSPLVVGAEICEDLWMPIPPSSYQAMAGANLLVNLSASNETVAKNEYRTNLIAQQSGRCVAAYAYSSAGPSESTTDLVFGGHCAIAENGTILSESERVGQPDDPVVFGPWFTITDVDVDKLMTERRILTSYADASGHLEQEFRTIPFLGKNSGNRLLRKVNGQPFVPQDEKKLKHRCAEVFGIQCMGLAKRLQAIRCPDIYIGVSGGLDSTLALLVAVKTFKKLGLDLKKIHGITMPGFGTPSDSFNYAIELMTCLGVSQEVIDIREPALEAFKAMGHKPFGIDVVRMSLAEFIAALKKIKPEVADKGDLVFENVQARLRTFFLMSKGFVLGTGDWSELLVGFCTFNGDHMSMYNPNASVPKTLVRWMVSYVADTECGPKATQGESLDIFAKDGKSILHDTLKSIAFQVISPHLLPTDLTGETTQSSEEILGPYELIDFFGWHFERYGFSPEKLMYLSDFADFSKPYSKELRLKTLETMLRRFFPNQFKRSCSPDGAKVGISHSPRGDLRMPSDTDFSIWLDNFATLQKEQIAR